MPNLERARWHKALREQEVMGSLGEGDMSRYRKLLRSHGWSAGDGPVMLSYATTVSATWLLGLSAAAHGLPLAVAGIGMPGWYWWEGGRKQIPGSHRALQVLDAVLAPNTPVMLTDHGDIGDAHTYHTPHTLV